MKRLVLSAIAYLFLLGMLLLLVTNANAADVTFTASLQAYSQDVYVDLVLTNCGLDAQGRSNIPMTAAGVRAKLLYLIPTDATGLATRDDVTPNADITCGNVVGATRYRVEIRQRVKNQADPARDPLISANEFVIGPGDFTLTSAQPAVSPVPSTSSINFAQYLVTRPIRILAFANFPASCLAKQDRLQRSDPVTPGHVDYVCNAAGDGWDLVGDGGSGGSGTSFTLSLNGSAASTTVSGAIFSVNGVTL
jgi:hypothetical protein